MNYPVLYIIFSAHFMSPKHLFISNVVFHWNMSISQQSNLLATWHMLLKHFKILIFLKYSSC